MIPITEEELLIILGALSDSAAQWTEHGLMTPVDTVERNVLLGRAHTISALHRRLVMRQAQRDAA